MILSWDVRRAHQILGPTPAVIKFVTPLAVTESLRKAQRAYVRRHLASAAMSRMSTILALFNGPRQESFAVPLARGPEVMASAPICICVEAQSLLISVLRRRRVCALPGLMAL